jgi:prevent-host-death family protein
MNQNEVTVEEAMINFKTIIQEVAEGKTYFITKDNKPIVKLSSVEIEKNNRLCDCEKGQVVAGDDLNETIDCFDEHLS